MPKIFHGAENHLVARGRPHQACIVHAHHHDDPESAVRRLRSSGFTAPVLAVTAYAMTKDRDECLALGCDDHFSKPIEWDRFFLKLNELLAEPDNLSND